MIRIRHEDLRITFWLPAVDLVQSGICGGGRASLAALPGRNLMESGV